MSEIIMVPTVEKILRNLKSDALKQQIGGVKLEMDKLEKSLSQIKTKLLNAEKGQSRDYTVRSWLENLRDVCFDVDNVLDEIIYDDLRQKVIDSGGLKTKALSLFSNLNPKFGSGMDRQIEKIREKLDKVVRKMEQISTRVEDIVPTQEINVQRSVDAPVVTGRDIDKEKIIHLLTVQDIDRNLSFIPIFGMGGLGKTMLAQSAYTDETVNACFHQLKMWINVSNDFDLIKLTQKIIESASRDVDPSPSTGEECVDMELLRSRLRSRLQGKKFLLVLDDVTNVVRGPWVSFRKLLDNGVKGSKIILTTRNLSVGSIVNAVDPYCLQELPSQDCWSLFANNAFESGVMEQDQYLIKAGKEILKKCGGVPNVVKKIASHLKGKSDEYFSTLARNDELWLKRLFEFGLLTSSIISYNQLSSYLKQCFVFCSLFPRGYVFDNLYLVRMWNAQGYLQLTDENKDIQELGTQYIKELISRSFFQVVDEGDYCIRFKMHNLSHDLASSLAQEDCLRIDHPLDRSSFIHVPHVSVCSMSLSEEVVKTLLSNPVGLRTLLLPIGREWLNNKLFVQTCIKRCKFLWHLDLRHSNFRELPNSIRELKNLRYFDLSWNRMIKELPNSVCELLHLQTLALVGCISLEKLPEDIGNLISLSVLSFTTKQSILQIEKGIGRLRSLESLTITGCDSLLTFGKGMQRLTAIRTLSIRSCARLVSLPRGVQDLWTLETLEISDCERLNLMEWKRQDSKLTSLRYVLLSGLSQSEILPTWLNAANNLEHISIANCRNLNALSTLPNITSLQKLVIRKCPKLSDLPEGMASLRELAIDKCPKLSRRCKLQGEKDWRKIAHIPNVRLDGKQIKSSGIKSYFDKDDGCSFCTFFGCCLSRKLIFN